MSTDARVMCAVPACRRHLLADPRHWDTLTAAGWTCAEHKDI